MRFPEYLTAIGRESAALAAAAERGLDLDVPSCPGWKVRDVVQHTGVVHRQKERIVRERWIDAQPDLTNPPSSGLIEWFLKGSESLVATLTGTDPSTQVFSWYPPDQSVGFWYRRMAHETAIHRVDAELGHGIINPIDPRLAADGIDEILTVMMGGCPDWATSTATDQTLRIECRDRPDSWSLRFITWSGTGPESGTDYRDEPGLIFEAVGQPTTVIRGPAGDLDLFLWGRGPKEALTITGDDSSVDTLRAIAAAATG